MVLLLLQLDWQVLESGSSFSCIAMRTPVTEAISCSHWVKHQLRIASTILLLPKFLPRRHSTAGYHQDCRPIPPPQSLTFYCVLPLHSYSLTLQDSFAEVDSGIQALYELSQLYKNRELGILKLLLFFKHIAYIFWCYTFYFRCVQTTLKWIQAISLKYKI